MKEVRSDNGPALAFPLSGPFHLHTQVFQLLTYSNTKLIFTIDL